MSNSFVSSLNSAARLVRERKFADVSQRIGRKIYGRFTSIGFRRYLSTPFDAPMAKIPLSIRPLESRDLSSLFMVPTEAPSALTNDISERRKIREAGFETCFVAVTDNDIPCYMQWLIPFSKNEEIQRYFDRRFPWLQPNEMLLEGAFVPPAFRGMGIMPCAMALIAQKATEFAADTVITFVEHDNIPSLKGCKSAGFNPYLIRRDEWMLRPSLRRLQFIPAERYKQRPQIPLWLLK